MLRATNNMLATGCVILLSSASLATSLLIVTRKGEGDWFESTGGIDCTELNAYQDDDGLGCVCHYARTLSTEKLMCETYQKRGEWMYTSAIGHDAYTCWPPWIYYYHRYTIICWADSLFKYYNYNYNHRYSTRVEYLDDIIVFFSSLLLGAYQLDIISAHSKNQLRWPNHQHLILNTYNFIM